MSGVRLRMAALLVSAVAAIAAVLALPEARCFFRIDDPVYETLRDNFSDPKSGWPDNLNQERGSGNLPGYFNDRYHMGFRPRNANVSMFPNTLTAYDMSIEVDATRAGTVSIDRVRWGVVCRSNNFKKSEDAVYYSMGITNAGNAFIAKTKGGKTTALYEEPLSDNIADTSETNHIRGDCVGSALILHVNDKRIKKVYDTEISHGHFGLLARNPSDQQGELEVSFDNFKATVYAPTEETAHCLPT